MCSYILISLTEYSVRRRWKKHTNAYYEYPIVLNHDTKYKKKIQKNTYRKRQKLGTSLSTTACSTCETAKSWWAWAASWRRPPQLPRTVRSWWRATPATRRKDCPNRQCPPSNWAHWNRTCTTPDWGTLPGCIRWVRNRSRAPALGSSSRQSRFGTCPRTLRFSIHGCRPDSRLWKFRGRYTQDLVLGL